jgi:hypothetical protein
MCTGSRVYMPLGCTVPTRVHNALQNANIKTLDDIRKTGHYEFNLIPNLGRKSLRIIGELIGENWGDDNILKDTSSARITRMIEELEALGYRVIPPKKKQGYPYARSTP